jgi:hypothetical protein
MLLPKFRLRLRKTGFALMETCTAVGMLGLFIAILITVSSNVLNLLRTSKDNISASQDLQHRCEQLKLLPWGHITDAQTIALEAFSAESASTAGLSTPIETVVVSPYPAKAGYIPAKVVREGGVAKVITSNAALESEPIIRVDLTLTWKGFPKMRNRVRSTSILISQPGPTK